MTRVIIFTVLLAPIAIPVGMKLVADHERTKRIDACVTLKAVDITHDALTRSMTGEIVPMPPRLDYDLLEDLCAAEDNLKNPEMQ